jgi:hypothetical protein
MSYRALIFSFVSLCVAAACPMPARAQAPASNPPVDAAQTSGQTAGQSSPQAAPAKKVWTNEDVGELRSESVISTFSPANSKTSAAKSSASGQKPASKGKDAKWYRDQITKLEASIPPLDNQIAELQAAIDGKPTGNGTESTRPSAVKIDSWPVEMDNLQKKRSAVLSQINALYDDARHSGIPDSALPLQP